MDNQKIFDGTIIKNNLSVESYEIFNKIKDFKMSAGTQLLSFRHRKVRKLCNIRSCDKSFLSRTRDNHRPNLILIFCFNKGFMQFLDRLLV